MTQLPAGRRHLGARERRPRCPTGPSPARPARPRTTATPGSSATRRSSSPRCGSATRTSLVPMLDRVPRPRRRRRHVPGADLEDVHGVARSRSLHSDARGTSRRRRTLSVATQKRHVSRRQDSSSTTATAATRRLVVYFSGRGPAKTANCKPNEVEVPNVVGWKLPAARCAARRAAADAAARLQAGDARDSARHRAAQYPRRGNLSSFDKVTLVLAKPLHGVVPQHRRPEAAGGAQRSSHEAASSCRRSRFGVAPKRKQAKAGHVISQVPRPGVAAAPGMTVQLVVARRAR